ncbi:O-methyltransferase [Punctularia strigosozonata HHB-11173 SS5]|uniref:O-methyltransferase n=1 Tax=Punctularia strigosozonata (strain HHB-11173) TaxID=741275 RepID=UPI000441787D|nr:O-methyltransferase [Punctularia strigosozonata HHB-11173 SS5]EIN06883.1 O-methyltransferase [Punctularia strigosozonata HHB-11173 SS5]
MSKAVDALEAEYEAASLEPPSLDQPFDPTNAAEALTVSPKVVESSLLIVAAAHQLAASVRLPGIAVMDLAMICHVPAALQSILLGNVPEIIREAGPQGIHAKDIGKRNGMDGDKISRCLRLLATHHVFREVHPDVWAHNRLSSILDTLKPTSMKTPEKHIGTTGFPALIEHTTDEVFRSSCLTAETLTDPKTAHSQEPTDSPFNRYFNTKTPVFEWLQAPENRLRGIRFNIAMDGVNKLDDGESILRGFPWETLPSDAKVVDVGGGIGSVSMTVAKKFPSFRLVVQDLPNVVEKSGKEFWASNYPEALQSGRVTLQGHSFFDPQPVKDADLFMLRVVIHDWPGAYAVRILKRLREAAAAGKTRLLLVDQVVAYACEDDSELRNIPGAVSPPVPEPLLPNLGKANSPAYLGDFQARCMFAIGGQERTLANHYACAKEAGWKIVHVYTSPGSIFKHILAEAI